MSTEVKNKRFNPEGLGIRIFLRSFFPEDLGKIERF